MAAPPRINLTVLSTQEAWERISARRAARRAPGGGNAGPMGLERRHAAYAKQTPGRTYTPAQMKRRRQKLGAAIAAGIVKPEEVFV
jgi:hypothetical protein